MRVSNQGSFLNGLTLMQRLQSALDHSQRQISSGKRLLAPSEDPIAAAQALEIRESLSRLDQFDRNATIARNRLALEEDALVSVNNLLQRVRELALQANNDTNTVETRGFIAAEMREHLDHLVETANLKDGNGRYLFAGNRESSEPVSRFGSHFVYNGDQGQRLIQVGESRQVADSDSGASVFFNIRAGNGDFTLTADPANTGTGVLAASSVVDASVWDRSEYTVEFIDAQNYEVRDASAALVTSGTFQPGDMLIFQGIQATLDGQPAAGDRFTFSPSPYQDIFTTIDRLATAIETPASDGASSALVKNATNSGLRDIDQAIGNILDIRTQVGSRLASIDAQTESNQLFSITFEDMLSSIEDLDYAEAISRLSLEATALEAAQKSFARTQTLSLFNHI